jgi:hypothetical protein
MWFWTREEWCSNTPPAQMRSLTKWRDIFSFGGPNCAIAAAGYASGISTEMKSTDRRSILTQPAAARHHACIRQMGEYQKKLNLQPD